MKPNPEQHYTYADYYAWPGDERYELIDGEAYYMGPAPGLDHQDLVGEIFYQIKHQLTGKPCHVVIAPFDVRLPKTNETDDLIDTVVQPDISVFCDPKKLDKKGARGAPDWVIEVVSPSSWKQDHQIKRELFQRVGVPVYWVIDDSGITIYRLGHPAKVSGWRAKNMDITVKKIEL